MEIRLFESRETLYVPPLMDVEVAQVLRRFAISGEADAERCRAALADLMDFPVARYPHDFLLPRVWELRSNLTAYDATYVALAEALDAPLLTRDQKLANAPGHHARIELVRHELQGGTNGAATGYARRYLSADSYAQRSTASCADWLARAFGSFTRNTTMSRRPLRSRT